jgi:hypothetical protein
MAKEHTFDIVCKLDKQEVLNALTQAEKETLQRYDFKGSKTSMDFDQKAMTITLGADTDFLMRSLGELLESKLAKRGIPLAAIERDPIEMSSGGRAKQLYRLQAGIPMEAAKDMVKRIKDTKLKVQTTIQGDSLRVFGKALDDLQAVQKMLREADLGIHIQFENYR